MVVGHVDQVGVALAQVPQQDAEADVVRGQRSQVEGGATVQIQQGGVSPRSEKHLHHLGLPGDHSQVERTLENRTETRT